MSLSSNIRMFFFTHVFFFYSFSNGLKFLKSNLNTLYWLSIAHPAFQDIGIGMGCQKKILVDHYSQLICLHDAKTLRNLNCKQI